MDHSAAKRQRLAQPSVKSELPVSGRSAYSMPSVPMGCGVPQMVSLSAINPNAQTIHRDIPGTQGLDELQMPEWSCHGMDYQAGSGAIPPPQMQMPPPLSASNIVVGSVQLGYRADLRRQPKIGKILNCHQCKSNKPISELVLCGHININEKSYSTTCTKRFCRKCLWSWYMEQAPGNDPVLAGDVWSIWKCPCCRSACCCHRCRTMKRIPRGMCMDDMEEESGRLSPARSLARVLIDRRLQENAQAMQDSIQVKQEEDVARMLGDAPAPGISIPAPAVKPRSKPAKIPHNIAMSPAASEDIPPALLELARQASKEVDANALRKGAAQRVSG